MAKDVFSVGPVLSFRGVHEHKMWRVSALIGVSDDVPAPGLFVEDRDCAAPEVLLEYGKHRYLRYDLSCDLHERERTVEFGLKDGGLVWRFTVPGKDYAPRMAYVSCNGFSDPSGMRKLVRPENAVWADLLCNHDKRLRPENYPLDKEQLWHEERTHDKNLQRFHVLLMGGDQIYFDSIWEEIRELKHWVRMSRKEQLKLKVTKTLDRKIEAYYFELYNKRWLPESRRRWGAEEYNRDCADAMAHIPTIMMWDDHDIFDGWGSFSQEMQHCELFQVMFRHARRAFWVFQMQHRITDLPELELPQKRNISQADPQFEPIRWSAHAKKDPLALPLLDAQPGFSCGHHVGPVSLLVADLRTERSRTQILSHSTWAAVKKWLETVEGGTPEHPGRKCQHLILMSSVPVIHPKLSLAEGLLDTFGRESVVDSNADDLKDHWAHDDHEGERKRLLESFGEIAEKHDLRVSVVSGDVHVAAWGSSDRQDKPPTSNKLQIQQFTSSAVVHPSLMGVFERLFLTLLNRYASKEQFIDIQHSVKMMLFPGHNGYVMPARNWLALELDISDKNRGSELWTTWRCETEREAFSNHLQAVQPAQ